MEGEHGCAGRDSRRAIGAVAMLGVGEVPKSLMRRLVNKCVPDGSDGNESSSLFFKVKGDLVNGSSLLSEEGERGSFRLHPFDQAVREA